MKPARLSALLWIIAVVITLAAAVYQRRVGPTTDLRGETVVGNTTIPYVLKRSHGGEEDHRVLIMDPGQRLHGELKFKRYKTRDEWSHTSLHRSGDSLSAKIPRQPPGGKVAYAVTLRDDDHPEFRSIIPPDGHCIIRFRGDVPGLILAFHIVFIFLGMLWSNRTGLEALISRSDPRNHAWISFILLCLGGLVFGPIVQWYSFGELWTGFPLGYDLTDNKLLISVIAWIIALVRGRNSPRSRWYYFGAALVTFIAFSIPHSLLGTELDYAEAGNLPDM